MKHLIVALALATPLAHAINCQEVGTLAAKVMEARQVNVSMSNMMKIAQDNNNSLMKTMVIEAYEKPRFSTEEYQNNAIQDFRSFWELACYKADKESK